MFFVLAITATFAYALQNTLLAQAYRDIDQLSAVAYRGLTLGISFLPMLLLAEDVSWHDTLATLPMILSAALFGTGANLFNVYTHGTSRYRFSENLLAFRQGAVLQA